MQWLLPDIEKCYMAHHSTGFGNYFDITTSVGYLTLCTFTIATNVKQIQRTITEQQ